MQDGGQQHFKVSRASTGAMPTSKMSEVTLKNGTDPNEPCEAQLRDMVRQCLTEYVDYLKAKSQGQKLKIRKKEESRESYLVT